MVLQPGVFSDCLILVGFRNIDSAKSDVKIPMRAVAMTCRQEFSIRHLTKK